jgi:hypothetical protein
MTSARGSGLLYSSWPGSRTSRSAFLPETCLPERARLTAYTTPPTTSAAIATFSTKPRTKPTTAPITALTTMNARNMPTAIPANL